MYKINILWTGGWDSTYRVLRLMDKNVSVQPYYLKGSRISVDFELKAIEAISRDIRNHPKNKCDLLELIAMNVSDVPINSEITVAYENMLKTDYYGPQYNYLARFAEKVKRLELNIHKDDKAVLIIQKYGCLIRKYDDLIGFYYVLDHKKSSKDLIKVFGNFHFPILNESKIEMMQWANDVGLISMMNKTWFCHTPINDKPCGRCNPCFYTIEEGMKHRFTNSVILRYKLNKFVNPAKKSYFGKQVKRMLEILKFR